MFRTAVDARVDPVPPLHVLVIVWPVSEMVLTFGTRVRPLAGMLPPVSGQDTFEPKGFAAELARERHSTSVDTVVLF